MERGGGERRGRESVCMWIEIEIDKERERRREVSRSYTDE